MFQPRFCVFVVLASVFLTCFCQQYDFAAEMTRQCLVPDPVGLVDCVENKVTLPYLTSWVECTNSLGQNVRTSADVVNYRCKSVWEGKGLIPEVFFLKDCVIEKTGLPAKNVSAEVLGAYKECENSPQPQQQRIKTAPVQQQQLRVSSVEYGPQTQQFQAPVAPPSPAQQFQPPIVRPPPIQQFQAPIVKAPPQQMQAQIPIQRIPQALPQPQYQPPAPRPIQQQVQVPAPRPMRQNPMQFTQSRVPVAGLNQPAVPRAQYQAPSMAPQSVPGPARQPPYSQQYFVIYPRAPLPNQQHNVNRPILSQKTAQNPAFVPQQQIMAPTQQVVSSNPNVPFSYSFQINHPLKPVI